MGNGGSVKKKQVTVYAPMELIDDIEKVMKKKPLKYYNPNHFFLKAALALAERELRSE